VLLLPLHALEIMTTAVTILSTLLIATIFLYLGANLATSEKRLLYRPRRLYTSEDADFRRALGILLGPPLVGGNRVETLINGDQIFPAMLEAIESARVSVTFETFVFRDAIGAKFCQALSAAAGRGVKVHILLDWVGSSSMDAALLENTRQAGCEVELYHKLSWYHLGRLNNRTHRKLLVVDGQTGFTGGVGMGEEWMGNAQSPKHWREMHYRAQGPVVAQMQAVFIDNWIKATGRVLHGPAYFPYPNTNAGDMDAQMFGSSPVGGSESMHLMVLLALTAARRCIDIENAYFVPDRLTVDALIAAAVRKVKVRIIVPGRHTDARVGRWAAQALYDDLLRAGVEIFEYQPTMLHCKVMVIDELWTSVGSANFDDRSFRLNDEANLNVFSAELAREQVEQIERDIAQSKRMVPHRWARRAWTRRVYEQLALLLRSQL
jgi:cardiolipin synthase